MNKWFQDFSLKASEAVGTPRAFLLACAVSLLWLGAGPLAGFSDTWQLTINTLTSVVTFIVVFLIQYAQNRDTHAIRLKLDELLRALPGTRDAFIDLNRLTDQEIEQLETEFKLWRERPRKNTTPV